jgi:flavin reductase (DIM6/NTAB) family NADH-FMN oxidoreductase RutF
MDKLVKVSEKILKKLPSCALLVSGDKDDPNVMTVGWSTIGMMWKIPVIAVPVRKTRFSFELMDKHDTFTMCFPSQGALEHEIKICGSKSKRDIDKFKETGLTLADSKTVDIGNIAQCSIIVECRKVAKVEMPKSTMTDQSLVAHWYPNGNFHTIFYGEILDVYER